MVAKETGSDITYLAAATVYRRATSRQYSACVPLAVELGKRLIVATAAWKEGWSTGRVCGQKICTRVSKDQTPT